MSVCEHMCVERSVLSAMEWWRDKPLLCVPSHLTVAAAQELASFKATGDIFSLCLPPNSLAGLHVFCNISSGGDLSRKCPVSFHYHNPPPSFPSTFTLSSRRGDKLCYVAWGDREMWNDWSWGVSVVSAMLPDCNHALDHIYWDWCYPWGVD